VAVTSNPTTIRLATLQQILDDLGLLLRSADSWTSIEECRAIASEVEPTVRALAASIEARIPPKVVPAITQADPDVAVLVEGTLMVMRQNFERLGRLAPDPGAS
jgi:hypothetical protein